MGCEYCTDHDGAACYPVYGLGPHTHAGNGNWIRSTTMLPQTNWPTNYSEDPDCPGMGVWWCKHCGEGKPNDELKGPTA